MNDVEARRDRACRTNARKRRGTRADAWGRAAEEAALRPYLAQGARVVAQRLRTPAGEIDLLLELDGVMIAVEVKARRTLGAALSAVSRRGWARLGAAVEWFCETSALGAREMRFDLVAVSGDGGVERIENAPLAGAL